MQHSLVQPEVVAKWDETFAQGSDKKFPNLDLVRLEKWFFGGKPGKLLEYGFGYGINLFYLLGCGYEIDGVDVSVEAKKALERKLQQRPDFASKVRLHHIGVGTSKLPFEEKSFDYVVCISVLSLLGTSERIHFLLKEFARVLKTEGKILLDINGPQSDFARESEVIGEDIYLYRGPSKKEAPVSCYCPRDVAAFAELIAPYFKIDDMGFSSHKYFHSEIQEFIVCARRL